MFHQIWLLVLLLCLLCWELAPQSSSVAKQFCQLGEPVHGLTMDLDLMQQIYSWMLQTWPFSSLQTSITLASFHLLQLETFFRITMSPILKFFQEARYFYLSGKVARNSLCHLHQNSFADVLYLSPVFFTVQIRCPKHTWRMHHHFAFHNHQMARWESNFTICITDGFNSQTFWVEYSLDFCK